MKKLKLMKVITSLLAIISILTLNSLRANASWKQNQIGWWYTEENSWATEWKFINGSWYYFDTNGYMKTGWINNNNIWYYLNLNGIMQTGIVQIDGKIYCLDSNGKMLTGDTNINGQTYNFAATGELIGNNIPQVVKTFSKDGIEITPVVEKKAENTQVENKTDISTNTSLDNSSSNSSNHHHSANQNEINIIITDIKTLENLKSGIKYGTITLNISDDKINLNNIKADNLIINNANWMFFDNCSIKNITVNSGEYPKIELKNSCEIGDIRFNSTGRVDEDTRNYKNVVNNVYINTIGYVQLIGIFNNIEVLKENSNVCIGGLQSEVKQVTIQESSNIEVDYCILGKLKVMKYSNINIRRSQINELESNSKLDVTFINKKSATINNLINNSNDSINVSGYGDVYNIKEIKHGSITLADTINKSIEDIVITTPAAVTIN